MSFTILISLEIKNPPLKIRRGPVALVPKKQGTLIKL